MICEIGCGSRKRDKNSIGIDIRKTADVNILADARKLPFIDESFNSVYSSHTIEHFSHLEVKKVLEEWIRVLKPGGTIEIRCPDLQIRALLFAIRPSAKNIINIYGAQDYIGNYHMCGFSYGMLKAMLSDLGIVNIYRVKDGLWGIPFLPQDLHIIGTKE